MDNEQILMLLRKVPAFSALSDSSLASFLIDNSNIATFEKGSCLIRSGEKHPTFYILLEGAASVMYRNEHISTISPGMFLGEVSFVLNEERTATVIAKSDITAIQLSRDYFNKLPPDVRLLISEMIIKGLVKRVITLNDRIHDMQSHIDDIESGQN